jgi:hypothetical protein
MQKQITESNPIRLAAMTRLIFWEKVFTKGDAMEKTTEIRTRASDIMSMSRAFVEKYSVAERVKFARMATSEKALISYSYLDQEPRVLLEIARNSASPSAALNVVALRVLKGSNRKDPLFNEIIDAVIAHSNTTDAIRDRLEKERQGASLFGLLRSVFVN